MRTCNRWFLWNKRTMFDFCVAETLQILDSVSGTNITIVHWGLCLRIVTDGWNCQSPMSPIILVFRLWLIPNSFFFAKVRKLQLLYWPLTLWNCQSLNNTLIVLFFDFNFFQTACFFGKVRKLQILYCSWTSWIAIFFQSPANTIITLFLGRKLFKYKTRIDWNFMSIS